jgi:hypothetical protein
MEVEDQYEDEDDDYYDDQDIDDDSSWRVRRAALFLISTITLSRNDLVKGIF